MTEALFGKGKPSPANWREGALAGNCFYSQDLSTVFYIANQHPPDVISLNSWMTI